MGGMSAKAAKLMYVVMLGVATLVALLLRYHGSELHIDLKVWEVGCDTGTGGDAYLHCQGDAAVYRISMAMAVFFAIMAAFTACGGSGFHRGWWGPKLLLFFAFVIGSVFISNNVFDNGGYAMVARVASSLFLLMQILILIDFGYRWNESWVEKAYKDSPSDDKASSPMWLYGVLGSAAVLYILAVVGVVLIFAYYATDGCGEGKTFTAITTIALVVYTGVTLFRAKIVGEDHQGAVLPAAVVASYTVFLNWSALESASNNLCRPGSAVDSDNNGLLITISIIVAVVSLMWTSYSATSNAENLVTGNDGGDAENDPSLNKPFYRVEEGGKTKAAADVETGAGAAAASKDGSANAADGGESGGEQEDPAGKRLWLFHLIMCTASMYMAMVLTNWGAEEKQDGTQDPSVGDASMWVKIVSEWMTILLYLWTLLAPRLLANRDF